MRNSKNVLYIKGPVPGARNALLLISGPGEMAIVKPVETVKVEPAVEPVAQSTPVVEEVKAEAVK